MTEPVVRGRIERRPSGITEQGNRIALDDAAQTLRPGVVADVQEQEWHPPDDGAYTTFQFVLGETDLSSRAAVLPPGRTLRRVFGEQRRTDQKAEYRTAMIAAAGRRLPLVLRKPFPEGRARAVLERVGANAHHARTRTAVVLDFAGFHEEIDPALWPFHATRTRIQTHRPSGAPSQLIQQRIETPQVRKPLRGGVETEWRFSVHHCLRLPASAERCKIDSNLTVSHLRYKLAQTPTEGSNMSSRTSMLHVRVDEQLKAQATETLASVGLTISDAVRILLTRINKEGGLPAGLTVEPAAHDAWFRDKVQQALADIRPAVPHQKVMDEAQVLIDKKRRARS